jgi:V8-like Glu-specific endopeptidase
MRSGLTALLGAGGCALALVLGSVAADAAGPQFITNRDVGVAASGTYWTAARMQSARPMDLPRVAGQGYAIGQASVALAARSSPPHAPAGQGDGSVNLHEPVQVRSADDSVAPAAVNPSGQRFTNSRVVPMSVLRNTYPWQAVGKLFFRTDTGGNAVCSAAIVQRRVIATAGHCLFNPASKKFFSNFLFVPGHDNGASPCGGYNWEYAAVTSSWTASGQLPNNADFGVLVAVNKSCKGQNRIGLSFGWLGWRTNSLRNNHVTMLGYPCNLDSCQILQQTNAQVTRAANPNSAEAGTFHEGGASGGPWVQDWGVSASGQPANRLEIVGITSYQPNDTSLNYLGSSVLNNEWVQIFNQACARAGACS